MKVYEKYRNIVIKIYLFFYIEIYYVFNYEIMY